MEFTWKYLGSEKEVAHRILFLNKCSLLPHSNSASGCIDFKCVYTWIFSSTFHRKGYSFFSRKAFEYWFWLLISFPPQQQRFWLSPWVTASRSSPSTAGKWAPCAPLHSSPTSATPAGGARWWGRRGRPAGRWAPSGGVGRRPVKGAGRCGISAACRPLRSVRSVRGSSAGGDSALRTLSSLRGLWGAPEVPPLCREMSVSPTANVGTVGMNGLNINYRAVVSLLPPVLLCRSVQLEVEKISGIFLSEILNLSENVEACSGIFCSDEVYSCLRGSVPWRPNGTPIVSPWALFEALVSKA